MPGTGSRWTKTDGVVLGAALTLALAFVLPVLYRGWAPFDEGWILEQALRVQAGQLPHRDFDDLWTGGWSLVHAGLFTLFGPSMALMRTVILLAWIAGLVALFALVKPHVEAGVAGIAVVTAGLWTLWAWPLPLVNWFYFPLALGAGLAVRRHRDTGHARWLAVAGASAGALFVFKVTGLFLLAALLLWSVVRSAAHARERAVPGGVHGDARWVALLPCALHAALSLTLASSMAGAESALVLIGGPNLVLATGIAVTLWRGGAIPVRPFLTSMLRLGGALVLGFLLPVVVFLLPYIASHAVDTVWRGVFVTPMRRLTSVSYPPPWWRIAVQLSGPVLLLWWGAPYAAVRRPRATLVVAVALGAALGGAYALFPAPRAYLLSLLATVPLVVVLAWARTRAVRGLSDDETLLLVAVAATAQLIQVPAATVNYFLASAPLLIAAVLALPPFPSRRETASFTFAALIVAAVLGVRHLPPLSPEIHLSGEARVPHGDAIWIPRADSVRYAELTRKIEAHRRGGGLYVFPWHNELYYFTRTTSPVRHLTALLAQEDELAPSVLIPQLDAAHTRVVVIFTDKVEGLAPALLQAAQALRVAWPCSERFGRWAEVRWRPAAGMPCR